MKLLLMPLLYALAEAVDTSLPAWISVPVQLGSFGVLCYVVWWMINKVLPNLQATFTAALERLTADSEAQRKTFAEEMSKNRHAFAEQIQLRENVIRGKDEQIIAILKEQTKGRE